MPQYNPQKRARERDREGAHTGTGTLMVTTMVRACGAHVRLASSSRACRLCSLHPGGPGRRALPPPLVFESEHVYGFRGAYPVIFHAQE